MNLEQGSNDGDPQGDRWSFNRILRHILRYCPPPPPRTFRLSDHPIRRLLAREAGAKMLDVGSGGRRWAPMVVNLDQVVSPTVDVLGDAQRLPFRAETFDLVFCSNVLEHLLFPDQVIAEMHRVLRPGGKVFVEVPFLYPFHGSDPSGEGDYWRMTHKGLRHALRAFAEIESGQNVGPGSIMALLVPEFLALPFASRRHTALYYSLRNLSGWALYPLQYLDPWLSRKPFASRIAAGFYFLGVKTDRAWRPVPHEDSLEWVDDSPGVPRAG